MTAVLGNRFYVFLGDVDAATPAPYLIAVTPASGVLVAGTTTLTIKGIGLGAAQADYHGTVAITTDSGTFPCVVTSWARVAQSVAGGTSGRTVDPGAGTVDCEHTEIVVDVPAAIVLRIPSVAEVTVTTDGGSASWGGFTVGATGTVAIAGLTDTDLIRMIGRLVSRPRPLLAAFLAPGRWGPLPMGVPPSALPVRKAELVLGAYGIVEGKAVGAPVLLAMSHSVAHLATWSTTDGLEAALSLGANGSVARWLPDAAHVVPRLDLGPDVTHWTPSFGVAADWEMHTVSAPAIDPDYGYWASANRFKSTPAMVFDGNQWAKQALGAIPAFTWILVAVLHPPYRSSWYDILASVSAAADPSAATDTALRNVKGDAVAYTGAQLARRTMHPPIYKGRQRPVILVWSESARMGRLAVIDAHHRSYVDFAHANIASFDANMLLAVNGSAVNAAFAAPITVLDLAFYDHRISTAAATKYVNALDAVWGVHDK